MNLLQIFNLILLIVILILVIAEVKEKVFFNSKIGNIYKGSFQYPEFRVISITRDVDSDGNTIAKYEVICSFFSKENAKGFKYKKYYFYDKTDMYKIGDTLTFTKQ